MTPVNAASNMISLTLVKDRRSLVNLLQRNGVRMPNNPSNREITIAVLTASAKSPTFKNELANLLTKKAVEIQSENQGFVGDESDFGFTGIDDFVGFNLDPKIAGGINTATTDRKVRREAVRQQRRQSRVTETNPQGRTDLGRFYDNLRSGLTSPETINAGLNIGLTAINNRVQRGQNQVQAEAANIIAQQDQARQVVAQQSGGRNINTILIVGVSVLVVGVLAYFVAKK